MRARKFRAGLVLLAVTALGLTAGSVPASAADYERLLNGTFASGTLDPWWAGAGTSGRVTGGEFCTDVTGGTANGYDALAGQNGVPYENGQQYTLTFDAHAKTAQQISAVAGEAVSPYRQIARNDLMVTPATRHELHNEPVARQEVDDIVGWIRDRVSHMHAPAAAASAPTTQTHAAGVAV